MLLDKPYSKKWPPIIKKINCYQPRIRLLSLSTSQLIAADMLKKKYHSNSEITMYSYNYKIKKGIRMWT